MNIPTPPQPERTEFEDFIELADGRTWMICSQFPEKVGDIPLFALEQFPDDAAFEKLQADGRVWFRVDDLPAIVDKLTGWLRACRECAHEDTSGPPPHPNWGALEPTKYSDESQCVDKDGV